MKSAIRRGVKYARKLDGVVAESRLNALKDQQRINYEASMGKQIQLDSWIKSLHLGRNEVYYIIFAKQINKLMGKFRGDILLEEACGKKDLWQQRGLASETLTTILSRFNLSCIVCSEIDNEIDCEAAGCYWWNGSCHTNAPTCEDYDTQVECEAEGCYWYDGSCHTDAPPEDCFTQALFTDEETMWSAAKTRMGQKITIVNKVITKLGFWLRREGTPTGNVTFTIRRTSDDSIINSKIWGNISDVPQVSTYCEATFDTPVNVNEEVYLLCEYASGATLRFKWRASNICDGIYVWYQGTYTDHATRDTTFKYCWT